MQLRAWASAVPVLLAVIALAAGCASSGYQYVENDDSTVFIKVPESWDVVSEGAINFAITPDDDIQPIPGEFVLAWRATFDAAPASRTGSYDYVQGYAEVQPVDRRMQESVRADLFFPELTTTPEAVQEVRHDLVTVGDVSGHRMAWTQPASDGSTVVSDRLVLVDSLSSKVYSVQFTCTVGCYNANLEQIDEVMRTFTVEG